MNRIGLILLVCLLSLSADLSYATHQEKTSIIPTCPISGEALSQADTDLCMIRWLIEKDKDTLSAANHAKRLIQHLQLKSFVNEIIETHKKEIRHLDALQAKWYPSIPPDRSYNDTNHELHRLSAQDADYDSTFIHFMLARHQEVIDALNRTSGSIQHQELKVFLKKAIQLREKHDTLLNSVLINPGQY